MIHRDRNRLKPRVGPLPQTPAGLFQHIEIQSGAESIFLKQRDKLIREDRFPILMDPAHQRLRPADLSASKGNLRLKIQTELPRFQRLVHMAFHIVVHDLFFMKLRIEKPNGILMPLSGFRQSEHHMGLHLIHAVKGFLSGRNHHSAVKKHPVIVMLPCGRRLDPVHDPRHPLPDPRPVRIL